MRYYIVYSVWDDTGFTVDVTGFTVCEMLQDLQCKNITENIALFAVFKTLLYNTSSAI